MDGSVDSERQVEEQGPLIRRTILPYGLSVESVYVGPPNQMPLTHTRTPQQLDLVIRHEKSQWCLYTHDGSRRLGCHPSREAALRQERAVQWAKHASEFLAGVPSIGKPFKLVDEPHPLTPEQRSEASKKAWDTRGRGTNTTPGGTGGAKPPEAPLGDIPYAKDQKFDADGHPIPLKVQTVEEAVRAVLAGEVVELGDVKTVGTVLDKLAAIAQDAKTKGQSAPRYDLCRVAVANTNIFCGSALRTKEFPNGIPRVKMPQTSGYPVPGSEADKLPRDKNGNVDGTDNFKAFMTAHGVKIGAVETVPAALLKASQHELVGPNVAAMMTNPKFDPGAEPIYVSSDNFVIDGHHRWAAAVGRDAEAGRLGQSTMKVYRLDAPASEVLLMARIWAKKFGIQGIGTGASAVRT
jgi:hypothetical protein